MDKAYVDTVRLLLEIAPHVFRAPRFALKGGTALNLFVRNMPRLSVDIDVVYADHRPGRDEAMKEIADELAAVTARLASIGIEAQSLQTKAGDEVKILVRRAKSQVKVEVNFVFRGAVLPVEKRSLVQPASDLFTTALSVPVLAEPELYGSKLVAALDRQHPRDFFDVREFFQDSGLTAEIVECFVCYLAGHNRPIHEVLFSRDLDMAPAYENEFQGMTRDDVSLADLIAARDRLRHELAAALTGHQKQFLLSLASGEPEWNLMACPYLAEMPAIRWKLENLAKLKKGNPEKFQFQADELRRRFEA
jgi:predicted nucleotidyltransferase component of viral defense system